MVRKIYGRQLGDPMEDLNVNLANWGTFMNTTLRAAVHLGKDYDMNLRYVKNHLWNIEGQLFRETEKLVRGQTETSGVSKIDLQDFRDVDKLIAQSSLSIIHCQSLRLLRLCALSGKDGRRSCQNLEESNSMVFRQQILQWYESNCWTNCGIRVEDIPGYTTICILEEIQKFMCEPEHFNGRIIHLHVHVR